MQVCETPNDEAVRDRSSVHAGPKFGVPHSSKGVKINHEAHEGKEFAPESGATVSHNRNLAVIVPFL